MSGTGKRKGGAWERFTNWVAGTPPPSEGHGQIATSGNQYSQWPDSYDDTKLGGTVIVGGKACTTAGEVKAATAKFYGPV